MAIDLSFFRSETSQKLRAEGRAEALLLLLQTRGIGIDDTTRQRITGCTDPDTLRTWLTKAVTADRAGDIFAE